MTQDAVAAPTEAQTLSIGHEINGQVAFLGSYGAIVSIAPNVEALLHISEMKSDESLAVGDAVNAYVMKIDRDNRIALTYKKPPALPWSKLKKGEVYPGVVTRIESYGAFVDIGAERPGMVHVSEMTDGFVENPTDIVAVDQEVEVRVIKLNKRNRQIDLSMKTPAEEIQAALEPEEEVPSAMELAFRRAQRQANQTSPSSKKATKRRRHDQDDIIARTLRDHSES